MPLKTLSQTQPLTLPLERKARPRTSSTKSVYMNYTWREVRPRVFIDGVVSLVHWVKKGNIWFNERKHGVRTSGDLFLGTS